MLGVYNSPWNGPHRILTMSNVISEERRRTQQACEQNQDFGNRSDGAGVAEISKVLSRIMNLEYVNQFWITVLKKQFKD